MSFVGFQVLVPIDCQEQPVGGPTGEVCRRAGRESLLVSRQEEPVGGPAGDSEA